MTKSKHAFTPNFLSLVLLSLLVPLCIFFFVTNGYTAQTSSRTASKGTTKSHKNNKSPIDSLITKFNLLSNDPKKSLLRDNWLQLESQLEKQKRDPNAFYYYARAREELATRSFLRSDYQEASNRFEKLATMWPKSSLAPKSLFRAFQISTQRMKNKELSTKLAKKLSTEYGSTTESSQAQYMLNTFTKSTSQKNSTPTSKSANKKALAEQLGLTVKTVMLDAGHGGKDPGAKANGIMERNLTLIIVKKIGKELEKLGFRVLYTRKTDKYIALEERTRLANSNNVDIFISIHANANTDSSVTGLETYYLDSASNTAAAKVAARENSVSIAQVSDLQFILTDLMLDSKTSESKSLANDIHTAVLDGAKSLKKPLFNHGVRTAPFYVLMGARIPAILLEVGYLTNKSDASLLKNETYLNQVAKSVSKGVLNYRARVARTLAQPK